jgi:hypothetical protein
MKKTILSILLASSFGAFANEAAEELQNRSQFQGERTRAEVRAEFMNAKAAGTLIDTSEAASQESQGLVESDRSRASVKVEAVQAARTRVVHELLECVTSAGAPSQRAYATLR